MTDKDKLMYIPNDDVQNYSFGRLKLMVETQLHEPTNQNSLKSPKLWKIKRYYKA